MITAKYAGEKVAKYISATFPDDKDRVYDTLVLACNRAWQEGKWLGMTKEFHIKSQIDDNGNRYFIAPPGFKTLLAINVDNKKRDLHSGYFQFHKNGNGSIDVRQGCNWFQDVLDCGTQPTMVQLNFKLPFKIAFRSTAAFEREDASISIQGTTVNNSKFVTYSKVIAAANSCGCKATAISSDSEVIATLGCNFPITTNFTYIDNVEFKDIASIRKTFTNGDVEIIAIPESGCGFKIADLAPWETFSEYRRYLVPDKCGCKQVIHGLFKCDPQADICFDDQLLIIDNVEALISLVKGMYALYDTDESDKASVYISNGIGILEKNKRETEVAENFPVQVDGGTMNDPWAIKEFY